ncbi:MAG: hypothetical protein J3Q66DRAFT_401367 [Benniella sp.]|nr:MAG: hypothetical protein J3Q66DRAFT_401367 [Benniella sp.]
MPDMKLKRLNLEQRALVAEEEAAQQSLSFKGFETAFKFLCEALEQPYGEMPSFLWKFDAVSQGLSVMQFVLAGFSSKCHRNAVSSLKSERTFWVDRVAPVF